MTSTGKKFGPWKESSLPESLTEHVSVFRNEDRSLIGDFFVFSRKLFFVSIFLTERTKSVFMDCKNAKVGNHLVVKKPGRQFPKFDFKAQIFLLRRLVARDGKSLIFYSPLLFNIRIIVINNNSNFFYYSSNNGSNEIEHKFKARRNFLHGRPSAEKNPL